MNKEMKLELIKEGDFLGTSCDFYKDEDNNVYMTRKQIGEALQYKIPDDGIYRIHDRNKDRLDVLSVVVKLSSTDNKQYDTILYIEKGIYDICRFSKQPVANDFYDWVYDQVILIRKTGGVIDDKDLFINTYCGGLDEGVKTIVKSFMTKVEEQQTTINKMQPLVDDWSAYMDKNGYITISKVSKTLNIKGVGRNNLFGLLRRNEILRANNEPYQRYVDSGYFKTSVGMKNGYPFTQTLVSAKGMSYINKKMKEWGYS